ncbi:MAG TPA: HAMP domain-containing sensor histidine kinase [Candidatus Cloacimonadota bacterium]|nr:HAMP domain-containing sensor histidine kinase [Candidatus Cloacimonadota bacterium]HPT73087.1 HAMP domain-containing sensor histidine kinase [Candidatus Cloacimonadota bacterium]
MPEGVRNFTDNKIWNSIDWNQEFGIGLFIADQDRKLQQWNHTFTSIMNLPEDQDIQDIDVMSLLGLDRLIEVDHAVRDRSISYTNPGNGKSYLLKLRTLQEEDKINLYGMILEDQSSQHDEFWNSHYQFQLIKKQQITNLERSLEGLIHNINTPLNTIIGYVQILLRESPDSKALQKIMESGFQIDSFLRSILDNIEKSRTLFPVMVDINQLIQNELEICRNNLFFKHNVRVEENFATDIPPINMLYSDLCFIIDAILWNAIESMQETENRILYISTQKMETYFNITIKDTGCGIVSGNLPFIYEFGYTTKDVQNTSHLGLGLSFARQTIYDLKGKINIQSEDKVGTTVSIDLPLEVMS